MLQEILKRLIEHYENIEWSGGAKGAACYRGQEVPEWRSCPTCTGVNPRQNHAALYFPTHRIDHTATCTLAKDLDDLRQLVLPVAAVESGKGTLNQLLKDKVCDYGHQWLKQGANLECVRCGAFRVIAQIP